MIQRLFVPDWVNDAMALPPLPSKWDSERLKQMKERIGRLGSGCPSVSVVIPAKDEEENILRTLYTLSLQETGRGVEIIVVNNNSSDKTACIARSVGVKVFDELTPGISLARQRGLSEAQGSIHLCADADSFYPKGWIESMAAALENRNTTVAYGRHSFIADSRLKRIGFALHEFAAELLFSLRNRRRKYLNVLGFNFGFKTSDAREVGGFNTSRPRWSDGWMAMVLGEKGEIHSLTGSNTRVWTSPRRIEADGGLVAGFGKRFRKEIVRLKEYICKVPIKI